jgi:uncharacterized phage-associated protein
MVESGTGKVKSCQELSRYGCDLILPINRGICHMAVATSQPAHSPKPLSQLQPFNEHRFDLAMAYFSKKYGRALSQYDMIKLHVLADVFHTLATAQPMIGGSLEAWTYGPVVKPAYHRITNWSAKFDQYGEQPELLNFVSKRGTVNNFEASVDIDYDEFSECEIDAMKRAWDVMHPMMDDFSSSKDFFHNPKRSFIGKAWAIAKDQSRAIDWNDVIDAFDEFNSTDHSSIKTLMKL